MASSMIGDIFLYSGLLHPFIQHHFHCGRGDAKLMNYNTNIFI